MGFAKQTLKSSPGRGSCEMRTAYESSSFPRRRETKFGVSQPISHLIILILRPEMDPRLLGDDVKIYG